MNILLFGGSFNPPHLGHKIVVKQAFELIPHIDELWLMPTYNHTFNKQMAPAHKRLDLCQLLVKDINSKRVKVSAFEIEHQTSGSTFQTIQLLKDEYPNDAFSFLIGSDQLPVFTKWQQWEKLLNEMPFYVYPRAGYPMTPLYPGMTALEADTQVITNISSTLIRKRQKSNLDVSYLLPKSHSGKG